MDKGGRDDVLPFFESSPMPARSDGRGVGRDAHPSRSRRGSSCRSSAHPNSQRSSAFITSGGTGVGYPIGLVGEAIPLAARIVAVADAYQAMFEPRPYRQAFSHTVALARLHAGSGTQFDPARVDALSRALQATRTARADRIDLSAGFFETNRSLRASSRGRARLDSATRPLCLDHDVAHRDAVEGAARRGVGRH
jgi:hypothetical protein